MLGVKIEGGGGVVEAIEGWSRMGIAAVLLCKKIALARVSTCLSISTCFCCCAVNSPGNFHSIFFPSGGNERRTWQMDLFPLVMGTGSLQAPNKSMARGFFGTRLNHFNQAKVQGSFFPL